MIFNESMLICIYWYTSLAFIPKVEVNGEKIAYFSFVLIGDLTIRLPSCTIVSHIKSLKEMAYDDMLDSFLMVPINLATTLNLFSLGHIFFEFIKIIGIMTIVLLIFPIQLSIDFYLGYLLLQVIFLPAFLGVGLLSSTILLMFGRGEGAINKLISIMTIFSGMYFPTAVLPYHDPRVHRP